MFLEKDFQIPDPPQRNIDSAVPMAHSTFPTVGVVSADIHHKVRIDTENKEIRIHLKKISQNFFEFSDALVIYFKSQEAIDKVIMPYQIVCDEIEELQISAITLDAQLNTSLSTQTN